MTATLDYWRPILRNVVAGHAKAIVAAHTLYDGAERQREIDGVIDGLTETITALLAGRGTVAIAPPVDADEPSDVAA